MASSILLEAADRTVVLVDVPRSIEDAQTLPGQPGLLPRRRLRSASAPAEPFPTPPAGPPDYASFSQDPAAQLADLTLAAAVHDALYRLRESNFNGPWCLPRVLRDEQETKDVESSSSISSSPYIPSGAHYLAGSIADCRHELLARAPEFRLIVLDPPWPNRSARRRRQKKCAVAAAAAATTTTTTQGEAGYETATDMQALRRLLEAVPVGAKLTSQGPGLVAVWVTNKPACTALLTDPRKGVFRSWGVELVATWAWLKVTTAGVPVVPPESQWRKPWERLLLAARPGVKVPNLPPLRVIVGVPDVHSRKPHLRPLLAPFIGGTQDTLDPQHPQHPPVGLEVFARNLTAGWWSWGDEVLLFQQADWWTQMQTETEPSDHE